MNEAAATPDVSGVPAPPPPRARAAGEPWYQSSTQSAPATAQPATPAGLPDVATATTAEIMQARREGKIGDWAWPAYEARLLKEHGPAIVHTPSPAATAPSAALAYPSAPQLQDLANAGAQSAALEAAAWAPAKVGEFVGLANAMKAQPRDVELYNAACTAMIKAGWPTVVGNAAIAATERNDRTLTPAKNEDPAAYRRRFEGHVSNVEAQLKSAWGDQFADRWKAVADEINRVIDLSPELQRANQSTFLDAMLAHQIWQMLEYRSRARTTA